MSRFPAFKADEGVRRLQRAGFETDHVTGSQHIMRHPDGRRTVVPYHAGRDIKRAVLRATIRQAKLTVGNCLSDEFCGADHYAKSPGNERAGTGSEGFGRCNGMSHSMPLL